MMIMENGFRRGGELFRTLSGDKVPVRGSISAQTAFAPTDRIGILEARQLCGDVMTSSSYPMPSVSRAICTAALNELTTATCGAPV